MTTLPFPRERTAHPDTIWSRGGAWVIAQFPLGSAAALAAMFGPPLPDAVVTPARRLGVALLGGGSLLALAGLRALGRQLTPFPKPNSDATLLQSGVYGLVRHPAYGGAILALLGWSLLHARWSGLLASAVVVVFFDRKAASEERWLTAQFSEYPAYRARVRKLIPWVY